MTPEHQPDREAPAVVRSQATAIAIAFAVALTSAACAPAPAPPPEPPGPAALFVRHWAKPIYREDIPAPAELAAPLSLAAAPGEYEPASVGVRAQVALRGVRAAVSDLAGPGGALIASDRIEVRATRYVEPYKRWRPLPNKPLLPGWLDRARPIDLAARTTQQFWLTVHVPADARPGVYRGSIEVTAAEGLAAPLSLPLDVTVLPLALRDASPAYFLYRDTDPLDDAQLSNSRAHGMTTIAIAPRWTQEERVIWDGSAFIYPDAFANLRAVVERARAHGFAEDRPVVVVLYWHLAETIPRALATAGISDPLVDTWDGVLDYDQGYRVFRKPGARLEGVARHVPWRDRSTQETWSYWPVADPSAAPDTEYGRLVSLGWSTSMRAIDDAVREAGGAAAWHYLIDEPHHSRGAMRLALTMLRAADEAGSTSFMTCNEPSVSEPRDRERWFPAIDGEPALMLEPALDVRAYSDKYVGDETRARTREAGDVYGTYVNIYANEPHAVRYQTGFLAWRYGIETLMLWAWHHGSVPDGDARAFLRDWEAVREGIDDVRYVEALERALAEGRGDEGARRGAQALLARLREDIVADRDAIGRVDGETGAFIEGRGGLGPEALDRWRAEIARALMDLGH